MPKFIFIFQIILKLLYIQSFNKDIFIRMDWRVDDALNYVKLGATDWNAIKPHTYGRHPKMFIIKGKIGETLALKIYNGEVTAFLASIIKVGTTEFATSTDSPHWATDIPIRLYEDIIEIDVLGKKIKGIGVNATNALVDNTYTFLFKIPEQTYCSNVKTDLIIPPSQFIYEEPVYYAKKGVEIPLDFSSMAYTKTNSTITFTIDKNPWIIIIKSNNIAPPEIDPIVIVSRTPYSITNLTFTGVLYGQEQIAYTITSDGTTSTECLLNIVVCHPNCDTCIQNIIPDDINNQCTRCPSTSQLFRGKCYDTCLPVTKILLYSYADCITFLEKSINEIKEFNLRYSGKDFMASILKSPDDDNNIELMDFKYCIERLRKSFINLSNGEPIVISIFIIDYLPIRKIIYKTYDNNNKSLDVWTICPDLFNFRTEDIKLILQNPTKYFTFIRNELPKIYNLNDRTIHLYNTMEDVSAVMNNNMTYIDLGSCEIQLKIEYDLPINDPLYILVFDYKATADKDKTAQYHIFSQDGKKLIIKNCDMNSISMQSPINPNNYKEIKEFQKYNIDVFDPSDPFFNNICILFPLNRAIDIPRKDRVKKFLQNNETMCPSACEFIKINHNKSKSNCTCPKNKKNIAPIFNDVKNNLLISLFDSNYDVVLCYMLVFNVAIFLQNIGSWVLIAIGICMTINIFLFVTKFVTPLKEYLGHLHQLSIKNNELLLNNGLDVIICKNGTIQNNHKNPTIFKNSSKLVVMNFNSSNLNFQQSLTDDDYDVMNFKEMIEKDKRSLWMFYMFYLRQCHPFINTFFVHNRKILRTVKISKFFLGLMLDLSLSAFFYTDKYISNNNKNKDFFYNLPISIYTCCTGMCINILLNVISNSDNGISQIESHKDNPDILLKTTGVFIKRYKWRVVIYNIIQIIFMCSLWYYVAAFCSVYQNSQIEWIKSSAISNGISMALPIGICFLYSIIRKICIRYESKWLFKVLSLIMYFL